MSYKTYILTFLGEGIEMYRLHNLLQSSPYVLSYWNYLPLVYCFKSTHSVAEIRAHFDEVLQYRMFFIAEINPQQVDGRLSEEAWRWFREDPFQRTAIPAPSPSSPTLDGDRFAAAMRALDNPFARK